MNHKGSGDDAAATSGADSAFALPPVLKKEDGEPRCVGFELEYSGLDIEESARAVQELFGGDIVRENPFVLHVEHTALGDFGVEIDAALLADEKLEGYLAELGVDLTRHSRLKQSVDAVLKRLAENLAPCEIVMPPLPLPDLSPAERVVAALRARRAAGTKASLLNAFGLHINTDLATREAPYLLDHIRAMLLLFDWICVERQVDLTRRALAYVRRYPSEYEQLVLDPGYRPQIDRLIDDYLTLVGSRDFALDMMPAFAYLDHDRVMARAKAASLIKARPAFHYRLPNSRVNERDWRVADEWRCWVKVEALAADARLLGALAAERRGYLASPAPGRGAWVDRVRKLLPA